MQKRLDTPTPYVRPQRNPGKILEDSLVFWFWQTNHIWQREIKKAFKPWKITYTEYLVLTLLAEYPLGRTYTQKELLKYLNIHKMRLSRALNSLKSKGFMLIFPPNSLLNAKQTPIRVSQMGLKILPDVREAVNKAENEFKNYLSQQGQDRQLTPLIRIK